MLVAPIPPDEESRQAALDALAVLDSLPEAFSNAIATAAAAIANVPISAISLIDGGRQWFKGSCGLDVEETARDISFCGHAILSTEVFLVPDALADSRFSDNPMVTGAPFIRFYAGFPIVVDSHAVGSLCVIDDRPNSLSVSQIEQLSRLAAGTASWLQERRTLSNSLTRTEAELRYVTLNDTVTGLPNRLMFQDRLKQAVLRHERTAEPPAILYIDVDGFKLLCANLDEDDAGEVLREIGRRLKALCRQSDTVARLGYDQFAVLTESAEVNRFIDLALRIGKELAKPLTSRAVGVTASIGVACYSADGPLDRLLANADTAMLAAKRSGGNCCRFFEPSMDNDAQLRSALLDALRVAIAEGAMALHYQPKIHTDSGQLAGVEALLRWRHPQQGMISPEIFIPLAESAGLIVELGAWVINEACRQMSLWARQGIQMRVAVNLSVHQLHQTDMADLIALSLRCFDVEPRLLTCEITESVAMCDGGIELEVFRRIRATGVQLSIDDFGTGYSSLSYLRKLPVHQLKIDRSFVTDLGGSDDARVVVEAIIRLAHALRLEVVAEGVETIEQQQILRELGCDKLQGFLFARPMDASALTAWSRKWPAMSSSVLAYLSEIE